MKYLKYFESNDVLYQNTTGIENVLSSDFFKGLTMIDIRDETFAEINKNVYGMTFYKRNFYFDSYINTYHSTHLVLSLHSDDSAKIIGIGGHNNDTFLTGIAYNVIILEYHDDWFFVSIDMLNQKTFINRTLTFKCDTVEGVIQALNNYVKLL